MKQGKKSLELAHGFTATVASLLVITLGGTSIANSHAMEINTRLGTSNYKLVEKEGEPVSDGTYFDSEFDELGDLIEEKAALAEQLSEEGSVLLKNEEQTLPLDKETEAITLWGMNSHVPTLGGMIGSSTGYDKESGQKCYNLEDALAEKDFQINSEMMNFYAGEKAMAYARGNGHGLNPSFGMSYENSSLYNVGEIPASLYTDDILKSADDTATVIVLSRDNSEAADYHPDMENATEGDTFERPLALSDYERDMIELAKEHNNGKVIVLINADNPMEIEELKQDSDIDSILWVGAPGMYGFLGVADILSGDVNPSGHLSDTYAVNSTSSPAMTNFGLYTYTNYSQASDPELTEVNKADWYVVESEGIYYGYKYYETRYEDLVLGTGNADAAAGSSDGSAWSYEKEVSYPFGYGLSYTAFEQKLEAVDVEIGKTGTAKVLVTNTGGAAGKDVVQLYVQVPYTENGIEKSAIQLVGFGKTKELAPGESETVTVEFDPKYMASYDTEAVKADGTQGAWVLEKGGYYFAIGNGVHEALNNILANKTGSDDQLVTITENEAILAENTKIWSLDNADMETYSVGVENALQDCDINHFIEGTVEYTTRSDWSKGWEAVTSITPTEEMMVALTNENYQLTENGDGVIWGANNGMQMIDLMQVDEDGNFAGVPDIDDPQWDTLLDQVTLEEAMAFLETGGEVIPSINFPETFRNDGPLGFTFDQVGGYAVRWTEDMSDEPTYVPADSEYATYAMNVMPTEPVVAATFNAELVKREGELMGEDGLWANENSILAPGLNLHRVPYCSRNHEYYSEDAMLSNQLGVALCIGGTSKGLMMEPKHLAFNHQELNRSGVSTYFNEQGGRENELRAFQGVCEQNVAQGIMTGFNRAGATFSGADEGLQVQILRKEWNYTGWIATDMINGPDYMNWRDVIMGGGGTCLTDSAYESSEIGTMPASASIIKKDTEFQEKMKLALKYWAYNCLASNTMNGYTSNVEFQYVRTWWQNALIAADILLALLVLCGGAAYLRRIRKEKKEGEE